MKMRRVCAFVAVGVLSIMIMSVGAKGVAGEAAGEYARHFELLRKLSVAVAEATPEKEYGFRPHPESMDFAALMSHIATTNYQFCAGLKDSNPPALPSPTEKAAVVKFLADSFEYCAAVIPTLTEEQLTRAHLRDKGIRPVL